MRNVAALIAYLNERFSTPYKWGSNDSGKFIDGAVKAQTGKSALKGLKWSNKIGAIKALKKVGGYEAALDARFERIPVALAKRGDIAAVPVSSLVDLDEEEAKLIGVHPMIVEGETLAAPGDNGLKRAPRKLATIAWNIEKRKR